MGQQTGRQTDDTNMELIYVELQTLLIDAEDFSQKWDENLPLPYIAPPQNAKDALNPAAFKLEWEGIVNGIFYIALYEPKHEQCRYYRDFLLALEPELPYILRTRLHEQCAQRLWQSASDTARLLQFLLPTAAWPLLELAYIYEQQAEGAMLEQRFADCGEAWNLAALVYEQLLEREEMDARCHYQLGYYYLQRCDYRSASASFSSAQQLAQSAEHPLWGKSQAWLQRIGVPDNELWKQIQPLFAQAVQNTNIDDAQKHSRALWHELLAPLEQLLQDQSQPGCVWYLYGFCLLYGGDEAARAGGAFLRAQELGWPGALEWQLPYYLGLSNYLEGEYRNAEHSFCTVLQKDPQHAATWYWLERLYAELEDSRSTQYKTLLQTLQPDFPDLIQYFI